MKRFLSVVGAFIIATGLSCGVFTGFTYADVLEMVNSEESSDDDTTPEPPKDSEDTSEDTEYETLKASIIEQLEAYREQVTDDELNNKNINADKKAEIVGLYEQLRSEDQEPYTEFIAQVRRGGIPQLTYIGATEFDSFDGIDYYSLIKVTDAEDGEIIPDETNTTCRINEMSEDGENIPAEGDNTCGLSTALGNGATLQFERETPETISQSYRLSYEVEDSDGNAGQLSQVITVKTTTPPVEPGPTDPTDPTPGNPDDPNNPDNPDKPANPDQPGDNKPGEGDNNQGDGPNGNPDEGDQPGGDDKPSDDNKPDDNNLGDGDQKPGDQQPTTPENPDDDNKDDDQGDDNKGDDGDNNDPDDSGDNQKPDDNTGTTGSNGSGNNSNGGNKLPTTLPNTGPSAFLSKIPTSVHFSLLIGLVAATTAFCLTKKMSKRDLAKSMK